MVPDGAVAANKLHVPKLPFPRVKEDPFHVPIILISVLLARLSGEQEDKWLVLRGRDAALATTTVDIMYVPCATVDLADLKCQTLIHVTRTSS
jgi:hypothetical protein